MSLFNVITALKGSSSSGNYGHAGIKGHRGGSATGNGSVLSGMERTVSFDGTDLDIQYTKQIPVHPDHPEYKVADLAIGFPYIRGRVKGDVLELRAIGAGNTKKSGIGTAMVEDAMNVAGVSKIASTGVESNEGKAFLDKLAAKGFQIVGRNL